MKMISIRMAVVSESKERFAFSTEPDRALWDNNTTSKTMPGLDRQIRFCPSRGMNS